MLMLGVGNIAYLNTFITAETFVLLVLGAPVRVAEYVWSTVIEGVCVGITVRVNYYLSILFLF